VTYPAIAVSLSIVQPRQLSFSTKPAGRKIQAVHTGR
jgi:hypothetical protein